MPPHGWLQAVAADNDEEADDEINEARLEELEDLLIGGSKMELEALHWLGMDYLGQWLSDIFAYNLGDDNAQDEIRENHEGSLQHLEVI